MKKCLACGTNNEDSARFCSKCGADFDAVICPFCNREIAKGAVFCPLCGQDLRDYQKMQQQIDIQNKLLETDPALIKENNCYMRLGIARFLSGVGLAVSFGLLYGSLECGWSDSIGIAGLVVLPVVSVALLVFCVLRGIKRKKIEKLLSVKSEKYR